MNTGLDHPATVVRAFHALSDPTRLQIVDLLRGGERCVCELTGALDVAQSRLSFHLKVLKDAGVVADRRQGRWIYYVLVPGALHMLADHLVTVAQAAMEARVTVDTQNDCCPNAGAPARQFTNVAP